MDKKLTLICYGIFIFIIASSFALAEDKTKVSTIEVVGNAKIMVMPNVATISFTVESTAEKAQDAVRENAEQTNRLLKSLRKISEKETEIKTSAFSLSPIYEKKNRLRLSGYRVRNTVVLKIKELNRVGIYIDEASKAGADRIGSLTLSNDKEEQFRKEARIEALHDAVRSAEDLAKAAGLNIKRTLSISYTPRRAYISRSVLVASSRDTATPVEIGQIPIEATVNVIFEVN
jgi:uncharacterized protein YggE